MYIEKINIKNSALFPQKKAVVLFQVIKKLLYYHFKNSKLLLIREYLCQV